MNEFGNSNKEEYSYSHSSGEWGIATGKTWGVATGKTWGEATKEQETKSECPFVVSLKPCKQCPVDRCNSRTENFEMF